MSTLEKGVTTKRVILVRAVARRWVSRVARVEYRFQVLYGPREIKRLPKLLRAHRDGKVAMAGIKPVPDLGIREGFDAVELWSTDREALDALKGWFEKRGFETTGVW